MRTGQRGRAVSERRFYSRPTLKSALLSFFFVPIAGVLAIQAVREPDAGSISVLAASTLLAIASLWIVWRRSLPWLGPALVVDAGGLWFWPESKNAVFMPWADLGTIGSDPSDGSLLFHPRDPARYERPYLIWLRRPPYVPDDIRTADGEYFMNVVDEYWSGPDGEAPRLR